MSSTSSTSSSASPRPSTVIVPGPAALASDQDVSTGGNGSGSGSGSSLPAATPSSIKMDELLVGWLSRDDVYDNVLEWIDKFKAEQEQRRHGTNSNSTMKNSGNAANANAGSSSHSSSSNNNNMLLQSPPQSPKTEATTASSMDSQHSATATIVIPPFYPLRTSTGTRLSRSQRQLPRQNETWDPIDDGNENDNNNSNRKSNNNNTNNNNHTLMTKASAMTSLPASEDTPDDEMQQDQSNNNNNNNMNALLCVRDQVAAMLSELQLPTNATQIPMEAFVRVTKEICQFPSFFNVPLYQRILELWNAHVKAKAKASNNSRNNNKDDDDDNGGATTMVSVSILEWFWKTEMEPFDASERFFRLVKQPNNDCILRDDFLPFIKALLSEHPGLEFLANHAEFQEKYAVTVITRIFYCVNKCHSGRITSRQIRRSDLLDTFASVDEEEDINKVTRYFSYEHFYVLYCRFWELDHDRDYRITREDLLKYGDHSLSHMIVDRIFDAAPRPFGAANIDREYLSYEDFVYFMLSEEDKANDVSVQYWFTCVDVDGDDRLNNMEMRSFYAVQLHRMQCMGHEIVPFEDMLCQMMDMIKPKNQDYILPEDFTQPECKQVSGALFDALFNLNKYLMFEQRDPFVERQKREDEFETDWDRFACIDYNRLAMEEEAREEEAMEIDWVTEDEAEQGQQGGPDAGGDFEGPVTSEAPF